MALTGVMGAPVAAARTGPHETLRLSGTDRRVFAHGGIETHPDTGRTKLNLSTRRPNLSYLAPEGRALEIVDLPPDLRLSSIRHLAARPGGRIAAALQWQGDAAEAPPLLLLHRRSDEPRLATAPFGAQMAMQGDAASVAFSGDGAGVAVTSSAAGRPSSWTPTPAHSQPPTPRAPCAASPPRPAASSLDLA